MIDLECKKIRKIAYADKELFDEFRETPIYNSIKKRIFYAKAILENPHRNDYKELFLIEDKNIRNFFELIS